VNFPANTSKEFLRNLSFVLVFCAIRCVPYELRSKSCEYEYFTLHTQNYYFKLFSQLQVRERVSSKTGSCFLLFPFQLLVIYEIIRPSE